MDTKSDPCVWLDYLATVFRGISNLLPRLDDKYRRSHLNSTGSSDQQQPSNTTNGTNSASTDAEVASLAESAQTCLEASLRVVSQLVWPILSRALSHYALDSRAMERCCRAIRFMARTFSINLRNLLPDIANKVWRLGSLVAVVFSSSSSSPQG